MKNYLKITVLIIVFIFSSILNLCTVYASSIEPNVGFVGDKTQLKSGETVTITLSVKNSDGIEGFDSTLTYDKTKLELVKSVSNDFSDLSDEDALTGEYKLSIISNSSDIIKDATLATLQFKVLDNVEVDEVLNITLSDIQLGDSNENWVEIDSKNVNLTIIEETSDDENDQSNNNQGSNNQNNNNNNNQVSNNQDKNDKDETQADKNINQAGLENVSFIVILGILTISIISYTKYIKYKNI